MPRILKYPLEPKPMQKVKTGAGKVLTVQFQDDRLVMWVLVEDETKIVERIVHQAMTGKSFDPGEANYVTTINLLFIVLHVFVTDGVEEAASIAEN